MIILRRIALVLLLLLVLLMIGLGFIGITPAFLYNTPGVGTGIGSKLMCSARFVSGFPEQQAYRDLIQYSPLLELLELETDEQSREVTARFFGINSATASFRPGLGCAVDYAGYDALDEVETRTLPDSAATWPAGGSVDSIEGSVQNLLQELVQGDNQAGLNTRALLVVHDGDIVAEAYAQGADVDTPLLGWSMAKSLVSVMLGNLEMRGMIDLSGPAGFEAWANDARAEIGVVDLLTMTDGLDFSENYNPGDDATSMLFTSPSASEFTLQKPLAHTPGTRFNYSSGTANLLSRLYGDALGSPQAAYDNYFDAIAKPLGISNAVFEMDASGVFFGSSYFYASARDWARLGQLMLNEGAINGNRLVTEDWVHRATEPNLSENGPAYGYQWWLNRGDDSLRWPSLPEDAFAANGNRQQVIMVVPSSGAVIVRLGWTAGRYPVDSHFSRILEALTPTEATSDSGL